MTVPSLTRVLSHAARLAAFFLIAGETFRCDVQDATPPNQPLAYFARMMGGEWKMTVASGTSSFRNWHWGPGQHSLRVMNDGQDAAGNPWLDFDVVYWHPGRKEIRVFGVSQFSRGITDGVAAVDGDRAVVDFDLYQTGGRRRLRSELAFKGPDRHHARLLETNLDASQPYAMLTEWDLVRNDPPDDSRPIELGDAKEPGELIRPLQSLLGHWEAWENAASDSPFHLYATIEWIPRADAIYVRVTMPNEDDGPIHLLDGYLYHHTGTGRLRCLALLNDGRIHEGDIAVLDDGSLQFDLPGFEGDQEVACTATIAFDSSRAMRLSVWSGEGDQRELLIDSRVGLRGIPAIQQPPEESVPGQPKPSPATGEIVHDLGPNVPYVFQARNGDYWFGTRNGAYRHDGKSLVKFTTRDGLSSDQISGFQEDHSGNLYLSTWGGVNRFDGRAFTPVPVSNSSDTADWRLNPDDLWFGGPTGAGIVFRFDGAMLHPLVLPATPRGEEHRARHPRWRYPNANYNPYDVYSILKDSQGHIWLGTDQVGVCRYDGKSFEWLTGPNLVGAPVRALFEDSKGNYWLSGSGAGSVGEGRPVEGFERLQTGAQGMLADGMSFVEDAEGRLWAANYTAGATRSDANGSVDFPIRDGEEIVQVFTVFKDHRGTIWLGTHNGGAWLFDGKEFQRFRPVW